MLPNKRAFSLAMVVAVSSDWSSLGCHAARHTAADLPALNLSMKPVQLTSPALRPNSKTIPFSPGHCTDDDSSGSQFYTL